jgi:hypothetical protein
LITDAHRLAVIDELLAFHDERGALYVSASVHKYRADAVTRQCQRRLDMSIALDGKRNTYPGDGPICGQPVTHISRRYPEATDGEMTCAAHKNEGAAKLRTDLFGLTVKVVPPSTKLEAPKVITSPEQYEVEFGERCPNWIREVTTNPDPTLVIRANGGTLEELAKMSSTADPETKTEPQNEAPEVAGCYECGAAAVTHELDGRTESFCSIECACAMAGRIGFGVSYATTTSEPVGYEATEEIEE